MDGGEHKLPEDLMIEILSRLPVQSLIRLKCVNKSWYSMIKNHTFISKHIKNYNNVRLVCNYRDQMLEDIGFILFPDDTLTDFSFQNLDALYPNQLGNDCIVCMGSFDGLFCLFGKKSCRLVIWNPATRESRFLPRIVTHPPHYVRVWYSNMGFELDHISGDYKFVLLRNMLDEDDRSQYVFPYVSIYTLSTNYWRDLKVDKFASYSSIQPIARYTYLNGVCYWLAWTRARQFILSFHMKEEVFHEINEPSIPHHAGATIGVTNDTLSLVVFEKVESNFDIWIMKQTYWTKQYTVGPVLGIIEPLAFWKNGAFFIRSTNETLVLYNPVTQVMRDFELETSGIEMFKFKDCLLPIKQENTPFEVLDISWNVLEVDEHGS